MEKRRAKLQYITAVVLFGTNGMLLRFVSLPSEIVVLCRGLLGTAFIALFLCAKGRRPDRYAVHRNLKWLVLGGACLGLNWIFLFAAYRVTTVAVASLCNYMAPIMLLFLAPFLFGEKLTWKKLLCVLAALSGIVLVSGVLTGGAANVNGRGIALGLAAAAGFAAVVVCNKKLDGIDPLDKTLIQLFVSALVVFPYVVYRNTGTWLSLSAQDVLVVLILGVVQTGIAYILYFGPMGILPVQTLAILGYIEPVVSVLCSTILLREPLPVWGWLGAALIIGAAAASETIAKT